MSIDKKTVEEYNKYGLKHEQQDKRQPKELGKKGSTIWDFFSYNAGKYIKKMRDKYNFIIKD